MSYQDKIRKIGHGSPFDNDVGDLPELTEDEEFEMLRDAGMKVEDFADPDVDRRYAEWVMKNPPEDEEQLP
jgi:hypothetical protein